MFRGFCAEKEGFEPPDLLQSTVFKTAAFDRSAISPVYRFHYLIASANIRGFLYSQNFFDRKNHSFFNIKINFFILLQLASKLIRNLRNLRSLNHTQSYPHASNVANLTSNECVKYLNHVRFVRQFQNLLCPLQF